MEEKTQFELQLEQLQFRANQSAVAGLFQLTLTIVGAVIGFNLLPDSVINLWHLLLAIVCGVMGSVIGTFIEAHFQLLLSVVLLISLIVWFISFGIPWLLSTPN